jgi:hypothetical protein
MRRLSMFIPVHFSTAYLGDDRVPVFVRWWQWRGHIFGYKRVVFD